MDRWKSAEAVSFAAGRERPALQYSGLVRRQDAGATVPGLLVQVPGKSFVQILRPHVLLGFYPRCIYSQLSEKMLRRGSPPCLL